MFSIVFLVSGVCNGCETDSPLFDEVTTRGRRTRQNQQHSLSFKSRFLQDDGLCGCEVEAEPEGVTLNAFFIAFSEQVEENSEELEGIDEVENAQELDEVPPTNAPTVSSIPSTTPSLLPSALPSLSTSPTNLP